MVNMLKVTLFLAGLTGIFVLIGSAMGGQLGMMVALAVAVALNMGAWWFSDGLILKLSHARPVTPAKAPQLFQLTTTLAERARVPMPRLYLIDSETPNAFATGRSPARGAIAVTTGLLRLLDRDELAGVIAHELAHIKHRDTLLASVVASIAGAITLLAELAQWSLLFGSMSGGDEEGQGGGLGELVGGLLLLITAPLAALMLQLAISRAREYSADAEGARMLGNPLALASALEKLEWAAGRSTARVNPGVSHLYIVNPLRGGLAGLFRTHPDMADRIARLRALSRRSMSLAI